MGIEGPVLVPVDGRAVARGFHVELRRPQADIRTDQVAHRRQDPVAAHQVVEDAADDMRQLDAPDAGIVGTMAVLEVDPLGVGAQSPRLFAKAGDLVMATGDRLVGYPLLDDDETVAIIVRDLLRGQAFRCWHGRFLLDPRLPPRVTHRKSVVIPRKPTWAISPSAGLRLEQRVAQFARIGSLMLLYSSSSDSDWPSPRSKTQRVENDCGDRPEILLRHAAKSTTSAIFWPLPKPATGCPPRRPSCRPFRFSGS